MFAYLNLRVFIKTIKQTCFPFSIDKTPKGRFDVDLNPCSKKETTKSHPQAEKEPLEIFPNNINPKTGEKNGPRGPEPTRYGDWERKGRLSYFQQIRGLDFSTLPVRINLRKILPKSVLHKHIFLGFTVDGNFLISYSLVESIVSIYFWLIPINEISQLALFSLIQFKLSDHLCPRSLVDIDIRFIQSKSFQPNFTIICYDLMTNYSELIIWGQIPNLACRYCQKFHDFITSCIQARNYLNYEFKLFGSKKYQCPIHSRLAKNILEMGLPSFKSMKRRFKRVNLRDISGNDSDSDDSISSKHVAAYLYSDNSDNSSETELDILLSPKKIIDIPKCIKKCSCYDPNICWLAVQPSVCTKTGLLRLASFSNEDSNLRILSCNFFNSSNLAHYSKMDVVPAIFSYPQGTSMKISPLTQNWPIFQICSEWNLVTHNYCETCFASSKPDSVDCYSTGAAMPDCCLTRCVLHPNIISRSVFIKKPFTSPSYSNSHIAINKYLKNNKENIPTSQSKSSYACHLNESKICQSCHEGNISSCSHPTVHAFFSKPLNIILSQMPILSNRFMCFSCKPLNYIASFQDANNSAFMSLTFISENDNNEETNELNLSSLDVATGLVFQNFLDDENEWKLFDNSKTSNDFFYQSIDDPRVICQFSQVVLNFSDFDLKSLKNLIFYCPPSQPDFVVLFRQISDQHMEVLGSVDLTTAKRINSEASYRDYLFEDLAKCPSANFIDGKQPNSFSMIHELNNHIILCENAQSIKEFVHPSGFISISMS